jgi:hypothetical protein
MDPNVQIIDALLGVITGNTCEADEGTLPADDISDEHRYRKRDVPMISYPICGQATLMSCWEDRHYFAGAFPTLFPTGIGGHQDQMPILLSLAAFAQWALSHHSRRFYLCQML